MSSKGWFMQKWVPYWFMQNVFQRLVYAKMGSILVYAKWVPKVGLCKNGFHIGLCKNGFLSRVHCTFLFIQRMFHFFQLWRTITKIIYFSSFVSGRNPSLSNNLIGYSTLCIVNNGRLIMSGGRNDRGCSDRITKINSLVPPCIIISRLLVTMPITGWLHWVILHGGKVVTFGGEKRPKIKHRSWKCFDVLYYQKKMQGVVTLAYLFPCVKWPQS